MRRLRRRYGHSSAAYDAVEAARLYMGSEGLPIKTQQRFYKRMMKAIERAARAAKMDVHIAHQQITARASSLGRVRPQPGKDY